MKPARPEKPEQLLKSQKEEESVPEIIIKDANDTITQFDRNDIIVDDSPETRIVEIYELQIKSILKHSWAFYRYSTTIYDKNNKARIAGKRPPELITYPKYIHQMIGSLILGLSINGIWILSQMNLFAKDL